MFGPAPHHAPNLSARLSLMNESTSNQMNPTTNQEDTNPMNPTNQHIPQIQQASLFHVSSPELQARIQYPHTQRTDRPASPADWWRRVCRINGTRLFVSGDLPSDRIGFAAKLDEWRRHGITHIVDAREEWSDEQRVAERYPDTTYHWVGTHDDGSGQPDEWFTAGVEAALEAMGDPEAKVMIHCHMGVNRGPSMAFAVLLAMGWSPVDAAAAIREARPIAAILYADSALDWWQRTSGTSRSQASQQRAELAEWMEANQVDVGWVISRIRRAEW
ncbi:MAG: hypothetical protein RI900_1173 [Actinomycetota bacterium]